MILGEVKARPKDIISFSLDYISKSKVQTSNPSSSPIPLDTPARPADYSLTTPSNNCFTTFALRTSEEAGPRRTSEVEFAGSQELLLGVWSKDSIHDERIYPQLPCGLWNWDLPTLHFLEVPSWELTYNISIIKALLSRWLSFYPGGICDTSLEGGYLIICYTKYLQHCSHLGLDWLGFDMSLEARKEEDLYRFVDHGPWHEESYHHCMYINVYTSIYIYIYI